MHSLRESSRQQRGRGSWTLEEECRSSTLTVRLAIGIKITRHEPSLLPGLEPQAARGPGEGEARDRVDERVLKGVYKRWNVCGS